MKELHALVPKSGTHDLIDALAGRSEHAVFYARGDALDRRHAERLTGRPGISLFALSNDDHNAAKSIRDAGVLSSLLGAVGKPEAYREAITSLRRAMPQKRPSRPLAHGAVPFFAGRPRRRKLRDVLTRSSACCSARSGHAPVL